ncbi:hypothetical protein AOLI_G00132960 [Acnodon oligacanthus]
MVKDPGLCYCFHCWEIPVFHVLMNVFLIQSKSHDFLPSGPLMQATLADQHEKQYCHPQVRWRLVSDGECSCRLPSMNYVVEEQFTAAIVDEEVTQSRMATAAVSSPL